MSMSQIAGLSNFDPACTFEHYFFALYDRPTKGTLHHSQTLAVCLRLFQKVLKEMCVSGDRFSTDKSNYRIPESQCTIGSYFFALNDRSSKRYSIPLSNPASLFKTLSKGTETNLRVW